MSFSVERLGRVLAGHPAPPVYWVAFSGGLDSSVLLHAIAKLRGELQSDIKAVHIDHGLHPESAGWVRHCEPGCAALGIPLEVVRLQIDVPVGASTEACARDARYNALEALTGEGDCVLSAHHLDDQAETLLLQLLRGSGPRGLAAMPPRRALGNGWLLRPLLGFSRAELEAWAVAEGLSWVDDPSNEETDFYRNYLRHEIMPLLRERWPGCANTLARSASHIRDALTIVEEVADADLVAIPRSVAHRLDINDLVTLPPARQRWLLRAWIEHCGRELPDSQRIEQILETLVPARRDADPAVAWYGTQVRRFRDELWLIDPLPSPQPGLSLEWPMLERLELPAGLGHLTLEPAGREDGLPGALWRQDGVQVRFRTEGLSCRLPGREGSRSLKKVFKEFAVPPWLREHVPLIFARDQLVAVADYCVCERDFRLREKEFYRIQWHAPPGVR